MPDRPRLLVDFTRVLARVEVAPFFPTRLCRAYSQFARADGCAILLGPTHAGRQVLCVTDDDVSLVEDIQDALREGPSPDAFRTRAPVVGSSVEEQARRWPGLVRSLPTPLARRSLHAFPMQPDASLVGVITLHVQETGALARTPADLDFVADIVGAVLIGEVAEDDGHQVLWSERDRVSQATGMIVAQLRIEPSDALAVLRAHAFAHDVSVTELSRAVLARELAFTDEDDGTDGSEP